MPDLLAIEGLRAGYGEAVVLPDLSLRLGEGQVLALLGRNGTGKTTLINSIVGVTRRFGGTITLGGLDITSMRPDQRARAGIGWVPQERNIFRSLTVEENMTAVAQPGPWTVAKVYQMFPRLEERRNNFGNQLSGGEQQMLAIGRALTLNPKVLLLDEPTEGLAPIIVEELLRALGTITRAGGICSIIVEQNAQKNSGARRPRRDIGARRDRSRRGECRIESRSRGARTLPRRLGRRGTLEISSGVRPCKEQKPPFRADEVGSLLRPPKIKEARAKLEKGEISAADLRKVEDMEIEKVVHKQASIGLKLATDGEFRRSWWHFDFLAKLTGCELFHPDEGIQFAGVQTRHDAVRVIGKLDFPADHPMLDHFRFLKKHADTAHVTAKMTIPSPAVLHFRGGRRAISKDVYPDLDAFYEDLAKTYRKAVKAFYDAGCRYLQFDDTVWAYLCSQDELKKARERGDNPDGLQEIYARIINYAIAERPADMIITTHVCRGNFRSTWISSGGYEPVAETMLAGTNYDGYFLEYDSERAGGFEPLRYLPKGNKIVVVGVITSKSGELEKKDDIKRRLEEASKFAPLDQLALSPQCGFASTEEGNILTEEEQWAKLKLAVDIAKEVWGK